MKKHKNKIIAAAIILVVLAGAWIFSGNSSRNQEPERIRNSESEIRNNDPSSIPGNEPEEGEGMRNSEFGIRNNELSSMPEDELEGILDSESGIRSIDPSAMPENVPEESDEMRNSEFGIRNNNPSALPEDGPEEAGVIQSVESGIRDDEPSDTPEHASEAQSPQTAKPDDDVSEAQSTQTTKPDDDVIEAPVIQVSPEASDAVAVEEPANVDSQETSVETGTKIENDSYQAGTIPEEAPPSADPQDAIADDGSFTVTLTVRCDTVLGNMDLLNAEKHELVPPDGVIFPVAAVTAYEGESVFNILQREMRRAGIHMQSRNTPIYNSAYIIAINNLYEFDAGELSGWMYKVNGSFPNYGSSRYQVQPGDVIELHYTCDLGHDLGEYSVGLGQLDD